MLTDTPGLHHVTSLVGDPQVALDFHVETLGLSLVKHTVNHEDRMQYHFYFGTGDGRPGTLYTCFPAPHDPPGRRGRPQITAASFAVPPGSLDYWAERLRERDVPVERRERFGDAVLRFEDPAGTRLELVAAESPGDPNPDGPVPADVGITGLHGVSALPVEPYSTASVLETLGFDYDAEREGRVRYRAPGDRAAVVDLLDRDGGFGREGRGTVHHLAVRVRGEDLRDWHDLFRERDLRVSRIRDRRYFRSLYVRDAGGVLIELATEGPGLTVDEPADELGSSLVLPPWDEDDRDVIERHLPPVEVPTGDGP